jgi:hypothetical protein
MCREAPGVGREPAPGTQIWRADLGLGGERRRLPRVLMSFGTEWSPEIDVMDAIASGAKFPGPTRRCVRYRPCDKHWNGQKTHS